MENINHLNRIRVKTNKYRNAILVLYFGFTSTLINAQDIVVHVGAEHETHHAIGLNTIGFFDQFTGDDNETRYRSPYLITYSGALGRIAIRAGIGPEYTSQTVVHDGFTNSEENSLLRIDSRIGAGITLVDDSRWEVLVGLDATYGYSRERDIEDSGFDRITNQIETQAFGGGPFIQIAYQISKRVSLSTESTLYWTHGTSEHIELFKNFPDFNTVLSKTTSNGLDLTLPNTIFLRIHF
jgi:hypothetical protein